jgi:selenocysteine lyase/cysteine desulfurase
MPLLPPQRHLFDIPGDVAYFNCAYYSPQLNSSRDRLRVGVDAKSRPWERLPKDFFEDAETLRALAAQLFGGDADGYAIVPAASYGLSTAARAVESRLPSGDRILVVEEAFPSNYLPWERAARESGAEIVTVPTPAAGGWTSAILQRIDRRTRVVAVPSCHWTNGARVDLEAVGAACREVDALLAVDATQSLGAVPLSVDRVQPDFLIAAGYKWLLSPYGFGLLYVSERWRGARPLEETWQGREGASDFAALTRYRDTYQAGARRFDVGEKGMATILPGAVAALEQIQAWGVETISATLFRTNARIAAHIEKLGFRLPEASERSPHMLGARLPAGFRGALVGDLAARRIYVSQRGDAVRLAPHLHVTDQDVDRLLEEVDRLLS